MIKQMFVVFMMAIFVMSMPTIVHANFAYKAKLLASDGADADHFGYSVAISGNTAIVGARYDDDSGLGSGSAYVFVRDPATGIWTEQQKLLASDGAGADYFGYAVSISGDSAIVAAYNDDDNGSNSGSAYVFVRDASGVWSEQQKLLASDGLVADYFGEDVSISGETIIVGAFYNDDNGNNSGSAYIFVRDASGIWSEQQKLLAADAAANDRFGKSVSLNGNTAVVGADGVDVSGESSGAAYVFVRDTGTGIWSEQQKLLAADGAAYDSFSEEVSVSGDTVIVGAHADDDNGYDSGAAYVFVRDASGVWREQQKLLASDNMTGDQFGISVSISGDRAIVGAYTDGDNGYASGSAYVFVRDPATGIWTEQKLLANIGQSRDYFGYSVSISGDMVIVGVYGDNDNGTDAGAAYFYTEAGGVVTAPEITVTDSVASISDLVVGFGDVTELAYAEQTVTVTNDGDADLALGNIAVADALSAPFTIEIDNCSTQVLTPAANCILTLRFSPPSTGSFNDSFDIPSDDANENPVTLSVSGTGLGLPVADISVTDSIAPVDDLAISFGNVTQATTSDQTITISNDGNANLLIGNIATEITLAVPFSILNDSCSGTTVAPAASCTLTARFEPTATGNFNDSFDIPSNDSDEAVVTFNLSGTGTTPVADITVTDSIAPATDLQIPFSNLTVAGSSDQTVTISNDGNADLVIGNVAQTNVLATPFSVVSDNCSGQTLTAAASCTLAVRFAPTAAGIFNDSFDVPSNDPDESSVTMNVSARGLTADVNNPPSSPGLVSPANGGQGMGTSVLLEWNPATDPDGDGVRYEVYNCTDSDPVNNCSPLTEVASLNQELGKGVSYASLGLGGGMVILGITFAGGLRNRRQTVLLILAIAISSLLASCGGGDGYKTYRVSGLDTGTTYYWAIVAKDGNGGETSSTVWSYSTR